MRIDFEQLFQQHWPGPAADGEPIPDADRSRLFAPFHCGTLPKTPPAAP